MEAWPFTLAKKNAEAIRSPFPAGVFTAVGDADTGRGNTCQWCIKLHETLAEQKIPSQRL